MAVVLESRCASASTPATDDVATLRAALLAEQTARRVAEQRASGAEAIIAHLKLVIAQMRHDLPRERVVIPGPASCLCCQGKLSKLGEDVTETLEMIPRHFKVIQTVRERFACRTCEAITQVPAPFHVIPRGRAGPELLATILGPSSASTCR